MRATYIRSEVSQSVANALEMWFEYRGKQYSIIRSFTYPEDEYTQHKREQQKIDKILDTTVSISKNKSNALDAFFELIK